MFCKKCGQPMDDGAKFCENCGTPVEIPQAQETPAADSVPVQRLSTICQMNLKMRCMMCPQTMEYCAKSPENAAYAKGIGYGLAQAVFFRHL